jgi:chemotaxis protein CheD
VTAPPTAPAPAAYAAAPAAPAGADAAAVVGVGDLKFAVAGAGAGRLVTYALGSCLGVCVHDPEAGVAGLLHVMLPSSAVDPARAAVSPAMFVDTGVPLLFKESYKLGARKERLVVRVVGGAHQAEREDADQFQIGKRNLLALRKLLWRNNVLVRAEDVGGSRVSRTVYLDAATGALRVRATTPDGARDFLL